MTVRAIRDLVMRLSVSTGTLSVLGAALEERVMGVPQVGRVPWASYRLAC